MKTSEWQRKNKERKKDDLIYLNVYLIFHIFFFIPLSHNIHIQILHIDFYTFPYRIR